jgi:integrase
MEWRAGMESLSPSTINVRLSAMRKMISEARKNGMLGAEEAANLTEVPNISQKGTRLGNWLTREQAKELLAVPDRSTLKGKRDYVILALLVGCALRRNELAELDVETIQQREGRWVLADLEGPAHPHRRDPHLGQAGHQRLEDRGRDRQRPAAALGLEEREGQSRHAERLGRLVGS